MRVVGTRVIGQVALYAADVIGDAGDRWCRRRAVVEGVTSRTNRDIAGRIGGFEVDGIDAIGYEWRWLCQRLCNACTGQARVNIDPVAGVDGQCGPRFGSKRNRRCANIRAAIALDTTVAGIGDRKRGQHRRGGIDRDRLCGSGSAVTGRIDSRHAERLCALSHDFDIGGGQQVRPVTVAISGQTADIAGPHSQRHFRIRLAGAGNGHAGCCFCRIDRIVTGHRQNARRRPCTVNQHRACCCCSGVTGRIGDRRTNGARHIISRHLATREGDRPNTASGGG